MKEESDQTHFTTSCKIHIFQLDSLLGAHIYLLLTRITRGVVRSVSHIPRILVEQFTDSTRIACAIWSPIAMKVKLVRHFVANGDLVVCASTEKHVIHRASTCRSRISKNAIFMSDPADVPDQNGVIELKYPSHHGFPLLSREVPLTLAALFGHLASSTPDGEPRTGTPNPVNLPLRRFLFFYIVVV